MKQTIKFYIHQLPGEPQTARACDLSEWSHLYGALLGTQEIEIEFDEINKDPLTAMVENLEAQVDRERADSQVRVNVLLDKISKLKCLEQSQ
jgi:hypothetical protein